jgi:hypothetical protein
MTANAPGFATTISGVNVKGYPGYQSLYPSGNPPGSPQNWLQADANAYGPFGAILTSTIKTGTAFNKLFLNSNPTIWGPNDNEIDALAIEHEVRGDLLFAINYTLPVIDGVPTWPAAPYLFDRVEVYIPPEFQGVKRENIVASFTNDDGNIASISRADVEAEIVPNRWSRVRVSSDSMLGGTKTTFYGLTTGHVIQMGNQSLGDVWVWIRVNNVIAPTIAGKYFFKMNMRLRSPTSTIPAAIAGDSSLEGKYVCSETQVIRIPQTTTHSRPMVCPTSQYFL